MFTGKGQRKEELSFRHLCLERIESNILLLCQNALVDFIAHPKRTLKRVHGEAHFVYDDLHSP